MSCRDYRLLAVVNCGVSILFSIFVGGASCALLALKEYARHIFAAGGSAARPLTGLVCGKKNGREESPLP